MANEHFMFAQEPSYGQWTTPDKAFPVRSANVTGNQPLMIPEETFQGRGDLPGAVGEVSVGPGDVVANLRPQGIWWLIRSAFGVRAQAAAGAGGFRNKFLINDDLEAETFSLQKRYKSTLAESIRGAKVAGFTIGARTREFAMATISMVGKDSVMSGHSVAVTSSSVANPSVITTTTPHGLTSGQSVVIAGHSGSTPSINGTHVATVTGASTFTIPINVTVGGTGGTVSNASFVPGTWADGTAAPAVVDPVPYPASLIEPFKFYQGTIRLGGSVALTAGELVVTGGASRNDVDNVELGVNFNPSTDAYGINLGDRTLQSIPYGRRAITIRFDPNFDQSGSEFYNNWKNGARATVELFFRGPEYVAGNRHEVKITLPWVVYSAGGIPDINAQYGLKRHTVEGRGFIDEVVDADIGLVVQTTENLTV